MSDETAMMPISATREEVAAQPEVVARVLADCEDDVRRLALVLAEREVNQLIAAGSGDSWFAAQAVRLAFERYAGVLMEPMQAYEYAAYGRAGVDEQTAFLVISSSGRPTTTWDALDRALETPAYVAGVTDNPADDNPFVSRPHMALIPGAVKKGWPAQTTTATIAVLIDLAIKFGVERGHLPAGKAEALSVSLREMPAHMRQVLADSHGWAAAVAEKFEGQRLYTFVGGGPSYAVAQTGSALLAEGPQHVGLPLTVEEFHHGLRIGTIEPDEPVVLIAPAGEATDRCRDTAESVHAWGAALVPLVTSETRDIIAKNDRGLILPDVDEPMSALLMLLPLHQLSIVLAQQKVDGGYQRPTSVP